MYIVITYSYVKHIANICRYFPCLKLKTCLSSYTLAIILFPVFYFYIIFTEFRANGSWECIPVHPRLSLHKSKPEYCNVNEVDLHNTCKLCFLTCSFIIIIARYGTTQFKLKFKSSFTIYIPSCA